MSHRSLWTRKRVVLGFFAILGLMFISLFCVGPQLFIRRFASHEFAVQISGDVYLNATSASQVGIGRRESSHLFMMVVPPNVVCLAFLQESQVVTGQRADSDGSTSYFVLDCNKDHVELGLSEKDWRDHLLERYHVAAVPALEPVGQFRERAGR